MRNMCVVQCLKTVLCVFLFGVCASSVYAQTPSCEHVHMQADEADCDEQSCMLHGNVRVVCGTMHMWSDHAHVMKQASGAWGGAKAWGHVLLLENNRVVRCETVSLDEDHVQGKVEKASVYLKKTQVLPETLDRLDSVPDAYVLHGDVERTSADKFHLYKADFTQCDCQNESKPSWMLKSPHIDVQQGHRATVWWPSFHIAPFGLKPVPVLPPLLPLSVPLKKRAMGLLSPRIAFLKAPYPQIDMPWFIPLGESWDLTLAPGYRSDWRAPRMGAKLRYAPVEGMRGEWDVQYTGDVWHGNARSVAGAVSAQQLKQHPLYGLQNRVQVVGQHRHVWGSSGSFQLRMQWFSDDAYLNDFRVGVMDRVADYTANRAQVLWRKPSYVAYAGTEYMQRFRTLDAAGAQVLSNTSAYEWGMPQRSVYGGVKLLPYHVGHRIHLEGDVSWTRFGGYGPRAASDMWIGSTRGQVSYLNAWGPVRMFAHLGHDAYFLTYKNALDTAMHTGAGAEMSWISTFAGWQHRITPRVRYGGIPWHRAQALPQLFNRADERLLRETFHHLSLELDQTWWDAAQQERVRMSLAQPLDVWHGRLLQTRAEASFQYAGVQSRVWTQIRSAGGSKETPKGVRAVGLESSYGYQGMSLSLRYMRMSNDADVFVRDRYVLGGMGSVGALGWVHTLGARVAFDWTQRVRAAYDTFVALPREGQSSTQWVMHTASVDYVSGCQCWTLGVMASVPGAALLNKSVGFSDVRYQVHFELLTSQF
jgi:hypothetical protein